MYGGGVDPIFGGLIGKPLFVAPMVIFLIQSGIGIMTLGGIIIYYGMGRTWYLVYGIANAFLVIAYFPCLMLVLKHKFVTTMALLAPIIVGQFAVAIAFFFLHKNSGIILVEAFFNLICLAPLYLLNEEEKEYSRLDPRSFNEQPLVSERFAPREDITDDYCPKCKVNRLDWQDEVGFVCPECGTIEPPDED